MKYRPDRHVFPPDGSQPEKEPRWEQLIAWEIIRCIATGKPPSAARVALLVPPKRVFKSGEQWAGQNLTALGTVAYALAGIIAPELVQEMYFSQRTGPPEPPDNEGMSIGYGNYQVVAAVGGLELGGEAADESLRKLRRDLAWWILWSTPGGKVIAPQGRAYSAEHPEHAQEIVRELLGQPWARLWSHQWWAWTGAYSAQVFAVEGSRLNRALFTLDERHAFHVWRTDRRIEPPLAAILSELRAPKGARWELRAWADGSHAGVVSGLRSYIEGPNGMVPAVVSDARREPTMVWTDSHSSGEFVPGFVVTVNVQGHGAWSVPSGVPITVTLDDQGIAISGSRIAPVGVLPTLAPWEPSRAGVEGEPEPPPEEEEPMPEEPEEKVPPPKVAKDQDLRQVQEALEAVRKAHPKKDERRWAHRALVKLNKLGAWEWEE